jgi:hypothetical protein
MSALARRTPEAVRQPSLTLLPLDRVYQSQHAHRSSITGQFAILRKFAVSVSVTCEAKPVENPM